MDYSIDYTEGGTYTLTMGILVLEGFGSYHAAEEAYFKRLQPTQPVKAVVPVNIKRYPTEYDCYLDGEYVGSKRTRIEADQYLDKLVFERLSGQAQVRG